MKPTDGAEVGRDADGHSEFRNKATASDTRSYRQGTGHSIAHDAIGAHARDELGISETSSPRPIQAAFASAVSFAVGAAMPLLVTALAPERILNILVPLTSLLFLRFWARWLQVQVARGWRWAQYASRSGAHWPWG